MPLTINRREDLLRAYFGNTTINFTDSDYVGLATGNPGDTGGAPTNESSVTSRVQRTKNAIDYSTDSSVTPWEFRYEPQLIFGAASGSATITHWFMNDAATSGNTAFYEQFPSAINVVSSDQVRWEPFRFRVRVNDVLVSNTDLMNFFDAFMRAISYNPPWSNVYFGLSSTTPTITGGNFTEPVGGNYARVFTSSFTFGTAGTDAFAETSADVTFPTASADWTGLTHWGVFNASTGGTPRATGALDSTVTVLNGETPSFLSGDWRVESPAL